MYFYSCHKHKDCAVVYDSLNCPICNVESEHGNIEEMEAKIEELEDELATKTSALSQVHLILEKLNEIL